MRVTRLALVFAAGVAAGCMTAGPPAPAQAPVPGGAPRGLAAVPLVLDRMDFRPLGATVQFARIPSANELYDLHILTGLAHVLLMLPDWPRSYSELEALNRIPEGADLIVVLPSYPPTREAADAWNLVTVPVRMILHVDGPPSSTNMISDLNAMRVLERVIVDTEYPSRSGFERIQRPISFRVVRD